MKEILSWLSLYERKVIFNILLTCIRAANFFLWQIIFVV